MSFAENLHDCFDLVHSHSVSRRKGLTELISFLEEKASLEESYARGLEKLVKSPYFIATQGTLSHGILALKNDSLNRAMQARILSENITKDLVDPLKELLSNQVKTLNKTHTEGKRSEKERRDLVEKCEKFKGRYYKACKESEFLTIQLESPQNAARRDKMMHRLMQLKPEIEENLKCYKDSIQEHNTYKDKFTDFMSKILEVYQKQEEQRLESIKDCLRKLVVYETSYLRNLQYDIDNLARAMESVNTKSDLKQFIDDNTSINPKNQKFEFESYQGTLESFKHKTEPPVVKVPMNSMMSAILEMPNKKQAEEIIKGEIAQTIMKAINGPDFSTEELTHFFSQAKQEIVRKVFTVVLNEIKQNESVLSSDGFNRLTGLISTVLTEAENAEDVWTFKNMCGVLRFFKQEGSERVIQDIVKNHGIWKRLEFWDLSVQMSISEECKSYELYMQEPESREDKEKRLKNTVFCQLGTYGAIFVAFGIDEKYVSEIISKYACRYQLSAEDTNTLIVRGT